MDIQLPYGAVNSASKPVDAYIQPRQRQLLGQPTQPSTFGSVKGVQSINTGGTTFVQGRNSFADLAKDLQPFSEQLVKVAQQSGLAFAAWQMDLGEQQAMEQTMEAATRLDEEVETSELNRAASNRSVAMADPAAGQIMNLLNPYRQIGYQRGMAKRAGQEIRFGMAQYVLQNSSEVDYTAPDQGFAALQQIRADFTNQVLNKYGVDSNSPGFTKYTAPQIERASDQVAQRLQEDRAQWFDQQKPATVAALIQNEWRQITSSRSVTFNGQTYFQGQPDYENAVRARLNQIVSAELMTGGLPGQAAKWEEQAFKILAANRDYSGAAVSPLDYLTTQVPMQGADGKVLLGPTGQPRYYSWSELYSQQSIDSEIKYGQARFTAQRNQRTDLATQLKGQIVEATMGLSGPEREFAINEAVLQFIQAEEQRTGRPMDDATRSFLYDAAEKAGSMQYSNPSRFDDKDIVSNFVLSVNQEVANGTFNGAQARELLNMFMNEVTDPKLKTELVTKGMAAINAAEQRLNAQDNYSSTSGDLINRSIQQAIASVYPRQNDRNKADRLKAEENLRALIEPDVADALALKQQELQRPLTAAEASEVTRDVLNGYKEEDLNGMFPNGVYPPEKQGSGQSNSSSSQTPSNPTYTTAELGRIPNRRVVLRNFRSQRILDSTVIAEAVRDSATNRPQSRELKRAWRDAKAASLYDFIEAQLKLLEEQVPDYERPWTQQEWEEFRLQSLQSTAIERSFVAAQSLAQSRPMLASIQGSMASLSFGA